MIAWDIWSMVQNKPKWTPPTWLFGPAWGVMYSLVRATPSTLHPINTHNMRKRSHMAPMPFG